jgi:hypothetical protein
VGSFFSVVVASPYFLTLIKYNPGACPSRPQKTANNQDNSKLAMATSPLSHVTQVDWDDEASVVLVSDFQVLDISLLDDDAETLTIAEFNDDVDGSIAEDSGWWEESSKATSGWEEVSDVHSVISLDSTSFGSKKLSYRDMLSLTPASRSGKSFSMTPHNKLKRMPPIAEKKTQSKTTAKDYDEECDDTLEFDSTFVLEGVKLSGGGNAALRFKGNSKKSRLRRIPPSQRS